MHESFSWANPPYIHLSTLRKLVVHNDNWERDSQTPILEDTHLGIERLGPDVISTNLIKGVHSGALFKSEICNWDKQTTVPKWQLQTWIWNFPPHWAPICCQDSRHKSEEVPTLFPCKFNEFGYLFLYDRWALVVRASGSDGMISRSDGLPSIVGLALSRYMTPI